MCPMLTAWWPWSTFDRLLATHLEAALWRFARHGSTLAQILSAVRHARTGSCHMLRVIVAYVGRRGPRRRGGRNCRGRLLVPSHGALDLMEYHDGADCRTYRNGHLLRDYALRGNPNRRCSDQKQPGQDRCHVWTRARLRRY